MTWFSTLFAEQIAPDEVVVFLLLGTVLALAVAFALYAAVLIALWRWRMRSTHSLRALLLPSRRQLRAYAAEYAIATSTALLLSLTVATKHVVVQAALAQDIGAIGRDAVLGALPLGAPREADLQDAGASADEARQFLVWLADGSAEPVRLRTDALVRPLLEAGMTQNADLLVRAAVATLPGRFTVSLQRVLLAVAIALLVGYAAWFGWRRGRELQKKAETEPDYALIMKRLAVPALCIPLLLVSAAGIDDPGRIARSASAAAAAAPGPSTSGTWVTELVSEQAAVTRRRVVQDDLLRRDSTAGAMFAHLDDRLNAATDSLDTLRAELAAQTLSLQRLAAALDAARAADGARFQALDESVSGVGAELARVARAVAELDTRVAALADRLGALPDRVATAEQAAARAQAAAEGAARGLPPIRQSVDSLGTFVQRLAARSQNTGMLLVVNQPGGTFQVRRGSANGAVQASGAGPAELFAVPPGAYVVTGSGGEARATVSAGGAATARLAFRVQ